MAVFCQSLSYIDGTSDDLVAICDAVDLENRWREAAGRATVVLINDSCLALSVLVHNDGSDGSRQMRVLDITQTLRVPTIVTLDAHKHLGTEKGVSTVVGTQGTLSYLRGHVKVSIAHSLAIVCRPCLSISLSTRRWDRNLVVAKWCVL